MEWRCVTLDGSANDESRRIQRDTVSVATAAVSKRRSIDAMDVMQIIAILYDWRLAQWTCGHCRHIDAFVIRQSITKRTREVMTQSPLRRYETPGAFVACLFGTELN